MPSIISADLTVHGDIFCKGDIQIEGLVEGDVKSRSLTIGKTGSVKGAVDAETIHVGGQVKGQIKAKFVILTGTAQVLGDIRYENLAVKEGARLNGMCKRID
ncbi:MAG: polymer-forming cytoskeletal protein [Deltaproteobacteria bacterium]|nr:polymer-forming cytoskeletal protein [Deltaproteobacteria bacterium]